MADKKTTEEFKEAFVTLLGSLPNITACCRLLNIAVQNVRIARINDPKFDEDVKAAIEEGVDMLEEEARRRAVDGVLKPVFFQGEPCGNVREYSDQLLIALLKANRPKKYNPGVNVKFGGDGDKVKMSFNLGGD